jgi:formylglycine-generating enzyme required for sulfatase activity
MPRPKIFISYSHKDEQLKDDLVTHLSVLQDAAEMVEVWNDQRISAGQDWKAEIEQAMNEATVAVLLISANFLTSNFILKQEVPKLLDRRQKEGMVVVPVLARSCLWQEVKWLSAMQIRPKEAQPVWRQGGIHADDELALIAQEVADLVKAAQRQQAQLEHERLAREQAAAEQARLAEEQAEVERLAREHYEQARQARIRAAAERLARERLEQEEKERQEKEERERLAREKAEQARLAKEQAEIERATRAREQREKEERDRRLKEELILTLAPNVTLELVRVPAGEFWMGSDKSKDKDANDDELPQHKVHLDAYLIGKYPVTVAQFAAFAQATKHKTQAEKDGSSYTWAGSKWEGVKGADWQHPRGPQSDVRQKQNHPVTHISWDDARAFCEWVSKVTSRTVRLPTEAEWEKAARGTDGRIYPWGDDAPDDKHCNFNLNVGDTTPVGKYSGSQHENDSPYGCVDMAGNVWEWTSSLFKEYKYDATDGRENLEDRSGARVLRGGSFGSDLGYVRCACRGGHYRHYRGEGSGFRIFCAPSL